MHQRAERQLKRDMIQATPARQLGLYAMAATVALTADRLSGMKVAPLSASAWMFVVQSRITVGLMVDRG